MKKKTFFLSSLVAVAFFVAALTFVSCNKEDVDYDSMNVPTYVVTPDSPKSGESYNCPWCGNPVGPHEACIHHYGPKPISEALYCSDPSCPLYGTGDQHRHVFDVCSFGHATHYHLGGSTGEYDHHTHTWDMH
ncbi:MAG: hypothetical protein J5641_05920 [Bacteroidales bacterium]|nr:hypothetical protein [Bacteroidales bacterium]